MFDLKSEKCHWKIRKDGKINWVELAVNNHSLSARFTFRKTLLNAFYIYAGERKLNNIFKDWI